MGWGILTIGLFILIAVIFVKSMKMSASSRLADPREEMHPESRALYAPIRKLTLEIEEIATSKTLRPEMKIIATEALHEAKRIAEQVGAALVARGQLKKAGYQRGASEEEMAALEMKIEQASTLAERDALTSALAAKRIEASHTRDSSAAIATLDAGVSQAEAALSELRTRLNMAIASQAMEAAGDDSLRETVGRLKSLSVSVDEVERFLRQ